jgi:nucleoside 2-deoxyribosyltransferase
MKGYEMKSIYLAGPISGLTFEEAVGWRNEIAPIVRELGYDVFDPLKGKEFLKGVGEISPATSQHLSVLSQHPNIVAIDLFRVRQSDILLINFHGCRRVSIGTCVEVTVAHEMGKLVILIMDESNVHNHPFITQNSIVVKNMDEAITVLKNI